MAIAVFLAALGSGAASSASGRAPVAAEVTRGAFQGSAAEGWFAYDAARVTGRGEERLTPQRGGLEVELRFLGFVFDEADDRGRGVFGPVLLLRDGEVVELRFEVVFRSPQARATGASGFTLRAYPSGEDGALRGEIRFWQPAPGQAPAVRQVPIRYDPAPPAGAK